MKFNLIINATDRWQASCMQALQLCQAMVAEGHELGMVFFFGHSVKLIDTKTELHLWQKWQKTHHIRLLLCSAMLEEHQVELSVTGIQSFEVGSLTSWINAIEQADKVIELN